jgi:alkaline phosphatase D
VTLRIEVRDINGFPVTGVKVSLLELQAGSVDPVATIKAGEYRRHCTLEVNLPWLVRYRLAILFYSAVAGMFILILASSLLNAYCMKNAY